MTYLLQLTIAFWLCFEVFSPFSTTSATARTQQDFTSRRLAKASSSLVTKWKRVNPAGWFTFRTSSPRTAYGPAADAYAGGYQSGEIEIDYIYWEKGGRPNFLRDLAPGAYAGECERQDADPSKRLATIGGRSTQTRTCTVSNSQRKGLSVVEAYFPHTQVVIDGQKLPGEFYFRTYYANLRHRRAAWRIIRSLRFVK